MAPQPGNSPRIPAQNDLYTVLVVIAAALQFVGLIIILIRSVQLFDWPFAVGG
mgnify:CR=1 FL=1